MTGVRPRPFSQEEFSIVSPEFLPSSTVRVIVCEPKGNVIVGVAPLTVPNEPVQLYARASPSGSVEFVLSRVTCDPVGLVHSSVRSSPALAVGGLFEPTPNTLKSLIVNPKLCCPTPYNATMRSWPPVNPSMGLAPEFIDVPTIAPEPDSTQIGTPSKNTTA
jgi:hypothetical protein